MKSLNPSLTPDEIRARFPGASKSVLDANQPAKVVPGAVECAPVLKVLRRRKRMNKTETAYSRILDALKSRGEIDAYSFEGISLRWGGTEKDTPMIYTPDFVVNERGKVRFIEIKGGHIFDRDIVRFKGCRAEWAWLGSFEMHQLKKGEWKQIA